MPAASGEEIAKYRELNIYTYQEYLKAVKGIREHWAVLDQSIENLIERLTILTPHDTITLRDLPVGMRSADQTATLKEDVLSGTRPLSDAVDEFERELIMKALQRTGFNQTKAALLLGTSRRILKYRIEKLKITDSNSAPDEPKIPT